MVSVATAATVRCAATTVSAAAMRSTATTVTATAVWSSATTVWSTTTMRSSATTVWSYSMYVIMDISTAEMLTSARPVYNPGVVMVAHNCAAWSATKMLIRSAVVAKITVGTWPVNCHFVTRRNIVRCVTRRQRRPEYPAGAVQVHVLMRWHIIISFHIGQIIIIYRRIFRRRCPYPNAYAGTHLRLCFGTAYCQQY